MTDSPQLARVKIAEDEVIHFLPCQKAVSVTRQKSWRKYDHFL